MERRFVEFLSWTSNILGKSDVSCNHQFAAHESSIRSLNQLNDERLPQITSGRLIRASKLENWRLKELITVWGFFIIILIRRGRLAWFEFYCLALDLHNDKQNNYNRTYKSNTRTSLSYIFHEFIPRIANAFYERAWLKCTSSCMDFTPMCNAFHRVKT